MTPSNLVTLLRGPLVLLFLFDNALCRMLAIVIAMATDFLDGYLARRFKMTSQLGAFLDPLMDKIFVIGALLILLQEGKVETWQILALMSRDFAVLIFGAYLYLREQWIDLKFHSIWAGKIATTLQFFLLLSLIFKLPIPSFFYGFFIALGLLSLIELLFANYKKQSV